MPLSQTTEIDYAYTPQSNYEQQQQQQRQSMSRNNNNPFPYQQDYFIAGVPIQGYVPCSDTASCRSDCDNDCVEVCEVSILPSEEQRVRKAQSKLKKYILCGLLTVCVIAVSITVPLSLTVLKKKPDKVAIVTYFTSGPTSTPSSMPSSIPTHQPTPELYTLYLDHVSSITPLSLLVNITTQTPQYKALQWIYHHDPRGRREHNHPRLLQRYIAAVFYYSTSLGDGWADCYPGDVSCSSGNKGTWLSELDECDWFGFVECNYEKFITKFSIVNNQNGEGKTILGNALHGTIPSEFGYLSTLKDLTIVRNPLLSSTIPSSFSNLINLQSMNLLYNGLEGYVTGADLFGNMVNLREVYLNYNKFVGTLPTGFEDKQYFSGLGLAGNNFNGPIPPEYGTLTHLTKLELSSNQLTGPIPASFVNLTSLEFLTVANNNLDGILPIGFGTNMTMLYYLDLSNNNFEDKIPDSIGMIGASSSQRKYLQFSSNQFYGTIPLELSSVNMLYTLLLDDNLFHGNVPSSICDKRGENYGDLQYLSVDCDKVTCDCCVPSCHNVSNY